MAAKYNTNFGAIKKVPITPYANITTIIGYTIIFGMIKYNKPIAIFIIHKSFTLLMFNNSVIKQKHNKMQVIQITVA